MAIRCLLGQLARNFFHITVREPLFGIGVGNLKRIGKQSIRLVFVIYCSGNILAQLLSFIVRSWDHEIRGKAWYLAREKHSQLAVPYLIDLSLFGWIYPFGNSRKNFILRPYFNSFDSQCITWLKSSRAISLYLIFDSSHIHLSNCP